MKDYVLLTDSCCDLGPELAQELGVEVLPLSFMMDGKEYFNYLDGREMAPEDFYARVRGGSLGTTSAISVGVFHEAMENLLKSGKDVLCVAFSSALSTTYQSATIAAEELRAQYPDSRVMVVDSRAASLGQGLLVALAVEQKRAGKSIEEVAAYVEETRDHLCHWFTVDDLYHLKRGGRVSAAAALFGTMLQMKPVLHVDDEGHLIAIGKVRGRKQSLTALVDRMAEKMGKNGNRIVFISHGDCEEDADYIAEQVRKRFGIKSFIINEIGPSIGSHSGPGTVALFFVGDNRHEK